MRREFFRHGRYFFATVVEWLDYGCRIQLDDNMSTYDYTYAVESMGHMRALNEQEYQNELDLHNRMKGMFDGYAFR